MRCTCKRVVGQVQKEWDPECERHGLDGAEGERLLKEAERTMSNGWKGRAIPKWQRNLG